MYCFVWNFFEEQLKGQQVYHLDKSHHFIKSYDVNFRKIDVFEDIIMAIFRNDEFGISSDCTIHKFIVVWICFYQIEMEIRRNKYSVWIIYNHIYGKYGKFGHKPKIQCIC